MTPAQTRTALDRQFRSLDGLRGLAVLATLAVHFERFLPLSLWPARAVMQYGWAGVDLFFALSGFLITGILLETRGNSNYFSAFYARRTLRIFPIYYLTLAAIFVAAHYFPAGLDRVPVSGDRVLYAVYLDNWIAVWRGAWPPNVLGHFWSLAVEEQFYLIWPLCVLLVPRRRILGVAAGLCVLALATRCVWVAFAPGDPGITLATVTRMDSLLLGAVAAIVFAGGTRVPRTLLGWSLVPLGVFCAGACIAGDLSRAMPFVQSVGFSLLAVGFTMLVLGCAAHDAENTPFLRFVRHPALRRIGRYSYGMYVYHVPILGACELVLFDRLPAALQTNPVIASLYVLFLCLLTFAVAAASYGLIERPILRLKKNFAYGEGTQRTIAVQTSGARTPS